MPRPSLDAESAQGVLTPPITMIAPFTKVLVGTDFSEHSARAVERAVDVARRYQAKLHVVHVWQVPMITGGLRRALMGSVAERVVRLSPVPVLTIH